MKMEPVISSHIASVAHDPTTNTMTVLFRDGSRFHYADISAEKHQQLMAASSIGKHFAQHIKGKHPHRRA